MVFQGSRFHFTQNRADLAEEWEMNIWTGLLFLEGAVTDVSLARELAGDEVAAATPRPDLQAAARGFTAQATPSRSAPDRAHWFTTH
jgi:hypothetical protein